MSFRGAAALLRALALAVSGAVLAAAWTNALYATLGLAALVAAWLAAITVAEARWRPAPVLLPAAPVADQAQGERRLTALVDLSPAPLVLLDAERRLRAVNRAARHLFGTEDLVPAPPDALVETIAAGPPGRAAPVELAGRIFAVTTGDLVAGGAVTRLAALIDIDAELKAAEASTLRDLVQVLSHEIVNTLTPIASLGATAAEMLDDPAPDLPAIRDAVGTVARRAAGLQRFGEAYRALARLPAPSPKWFEAGDLLADLARLFRTQWPGVVLQIESEAAGTVRADFDQLATAVWALMQNAAEAVGDQAAGEVRLALRRSADLSILVGDNGPGIDPDAADRIFQPFYTTKPDGSGVGLALARQIMRNHGGDLRLERVAGGGAQFRAAVPIA